MGSASQQTHTETHTQHGPGSCPWRSACPLLFLLNRWTAPGRKRAGVASNTDHECVGVPILGAKTARLVLLPLDTRPAYGLEWGLNLRPSNHIQIHVRRRPLALLAVAVTFRSSGVGHMHEGTGRPPAFAGAGCPIPGRTLVAQLWIPTCPCALSRGL